MADLTNADLRATLPAGITISAVTYPDGESSLKAIADFLIAVQSAQDTQNAAAPSGEDVQVIAVASGVEQVVTRDGQTHRVTPVTRTVTILEKRIIQDVLPPLV